MLPEPENHMRTVPENAESKPAPARELACPAGYPEKDWLAMDDANKRAYLKAIEYTKTITGGAQ